MAQPTDEERGKDWVRMRVQEMAGEIGIELRQCGWGQAAGDFENDRWTLALKAGAVRKLVTFDADDLEDCAEPDGGSGRPSSSNCATPSTRSLRR